MTCDDVLQQLPWRLNHTLDDEQAAAIDRHVANCDRCREALADTGFVLHAVETSHPPTETLIDLAFGTADESQRAEVERHVAMCNRCRDELDLARQSAATQPDESADDNRSAVHEPLPVMPPLGDPGGRPPVWSTARSSVRDQPLLAALLALAVGTAAIAGWNWRGAHRLATQRAEQLTSMERDGRAKIAEARQEQRAAEVLASDLAERIIAGLDPSAARPVVLQTLMGGDSGGAASIPLSVDLTLSIQGSIGWTPPIGVEILDPAGAVRWLRLGVERSSEGPFLVSVPAHVFAGAAAGDRFEVRLVRDGDGEREVLARYPMVLEATAPDAG